MGENEKQVTEDGAVSLEENQLDQVTGASGDFHIKFDGVPEVQSKFQPLAPQVKLDPSVLGKKVPL